MLRSELGPLPIAKNEEMIPNIKSEYQKKAGVQMRLWHEALIHQLPRQQLLGQHRECCALRGGGWNKQHATVNYVFQYSPFKLYYYHMKVMDEMKRRGYHNDPLWENPAYRGKTCPPYDHVAEGPDDREPYPEHDDIYLKECLQNLKEKGVEL